MCLCQKGDDWVSCGFGKLVSKWLGMATSVARRYKSLDVCHNMRSPKIRSILNTPKWPAGQLPWLSCMFSSLKEGVKMRHWHYLSL